MQGKKIKNKISFTSGYATLMLVLVVSIISFSVIISALLIGANNSQNSLTFQQGLQAHEYTSSCIDQELENIHLNPLSFYPDYTDSGSFDVGNTSSACDYFASVTSNGEIVILATSTVGDVTKKIRARASGIINGGEVDNIAITDWNETTPECSITNFTADSSSLAVGGSTTIHWATAGCNTVTEVWQGLGVLSPVGSGSFSTGSLYGSTGYEIVASDGITTVSAQVYINVASCYINYFYPNSYSIDKNTSTTLNWSLVNCSSATIDQGIGSVSNISGSVSTGNLITTTTYTLSATDGYNNPTVQISIVVNPLILVNQWGGFGTANGQFKYPYNVALSPDGTKVYVADSLFGNDRIQEFDTSGNFIRSWGSTGTTEGHFNQPTGLAVDSSGNVYVADVSNNRVQKFDANGNFIMMFGWGVNGGSSLEVCTSSCHIGVAGTGDGKISPFSVAVDSSGNIIVDDMGRNRVEKFNSSGAFLRTFGWGVSTGANTFQVCTSGCRGGIAGSGAGQMDSHYYPDAVATDSSGNIFVVDGNLGRVQKFTSSGSYVSGFSISGLNVPVGITIDQTNGDIYIANTYGHNIKKYNSADVYQWTLTSNFSYPQGTAIDASGILYVADTYHHLIKKFTP